MRKLVKFALLMTLFLLFMSPGAFCAAAQRAKTPQDIENLVKGSGGVNEYPNADTLVLFTRQNEEYNEKGDTTSLEHTLVKILTENGKKKYATIPFSYHKRYQEIAITKARVIYPDGTYMDIPPESIKDGTTASTQEMNIYEENFREKSITPPDLAVGCCIEYEVKTTTQALIKDNYCNIFLFQGSDPYLECVVTVTGPASKPLKFVVKNGEPEFNEKKEGDKITYQWKALNVPQIITEPSMVPLSDVVIKLVASTFNSWEEISRYGETLNEGKVDMNPQLKETVKKLTSGLKTDEDKILAIHRYVSQKIRYMGSSMDVGAFIEPHNATYTFERQYGVCRDKSVLMMAMLKEIGIDCYDTLINVSCDTIKEIPTIYFQHAIAAVVLKDGQVVYMDPTLELSSSFGETYVGDRNVLLLSKEGRNLAGVPPIPAERSLGNIEAETELDSAGNLSGNIKISGKGYYDYVLRVYNQYYHAVQFERLLNKLGTAFHPKTVISGIKAEDPIDLAKPYDFSFSLRSEEFSIPAGKYLLFHLPLSSCAFDLVVGDVFGELTNLKERKYSMGVFSTRGCQQRDTLTIPEGFKVTSVPPDLNVREGPITLNTKVEKEGRCIKYLIDYRIEKSVLTPREYQDLRKVALQLKKYARSFVILEKE